MFSYERTEIGHPFVFFVKKRKYWIDLYVTIDYYTYTNKHKGGRKWQNQW